MPHRRSSDVASAVWLIDEDSISRTFTSPSVMGVTNQSALAPASITVIPAKTAYPQPAGNASRLSKAAEGKGAWSHAILVSGQAQAVRVWVGYTVAGPSTVSGGDEGVAGLAGFGF
ncbi:hypothetical protein OPT61_g4954 [Boeremia exigua]|uniref:Uncharacterized protein n=1 Tax=Boeremia exigua TaxID=749465 RepID=A0ACC2IC67_9PLEO|nr:hypothetical protein OPT61_g4954 [Boeremia exigua]